MPLLLGVSPVLVLAGVVSLLNARIAPHPLNGWAMALGAVLAGLSLWFISKRILNSLIDSERADATSAGFDLLAFRIRAAFERDRHVASWAAVALCSLGAGLSSVLLPATLPLISAAYARLQTWFVWSDWPLLGLHAMIAGIASAASIMPIALAAHCLRRGSADPSERSVWPALAGGCAAVAAHASGLLPSGPTLSAVAAVPMLIVAILAACRAPRHL